MSKIILKKDLIIKAGTVFENCDGETVEHASGNFQATLGTGKDGVITIYIDEYAVTDDNQQFELINDEKIIVERAKKFKEKVQNFMEGFFSGEDGEDNTERMRELYIMGINDFGEEITKQLNLQIEKYPGTDCLKGLLLVKKILNEYGC